MKLQSILAATAFVVASASTFAATGTSAFVDGVADYVNPATLAPGAFSDSITFTGIAAGKYDVLLDFSAQSVWVTTVSVNGIAADFINNVSGGKGAKFSFAGLETEANAPFTLSVVGTAFSAKTLPSYSGSLTAVAAVPEPETYALMLAGLGCLAFVTSRRNRRG